MASRASGVYVGTLVSVKFAGDEEPVDVEPTVLGVDPDAGIVQAASRSALSRGEYLRAPASRPRKVERLWYRRSRSDYPGGSLWYHELDNAKGYSHNENGALNVVLVGLDVERCPGPGDFLCG